MLGAMGSTFDAAASPSPAPTRCGWADASGGGTPFICSGLGPPVSRLKRGQKLPPLLGMSWKLISIRLVVWGGTLNMEVRLLSTIAVLSGQGPSECVCF